MYQNRKYMRRGTSTFLEDMPPRGVIVATEVALSPATSAAERAKEPALGGKVLTGEICLTADLACPVGGTRAKALDPVSSRESSRDDAFIFAMK
jgi:hypothetical protein